MCVGDEDGREMLRGSEEDSQKHFLGICSIHQNYPLKQMADQFNILSPGQLLWQSFPPPLPQELLSAGRVGKKPNSYGGYKDTLQSKSRLYNKTRRNFFSLRRKEILQIHLSDVPISTELLKLMQVMGSFICTQGQSLREAENLQLPLGNILDFGRVCIYMVMIKCSKVASKGPS